jgi:hypothetical protein
MYESLDAAQAHRGDDLALRIIAATKMQAGSLIAAMIASKR